MPDLAAFRLLLFTKSPYLVFVLCFRLHHLCLDCIDGKVKREWRDGTGRPRTACLTAPPTRCNLPRKGGFITWLVGHDLSWRFLHPRTAWSDWRRSYRPTISVPDSTMITCFCSNPLSRADLGLHNDESATKLCKFVVLGLPLKRVGTTSTFQSYAPSLDTAKRYMYLTQVSFPSHTSLIGRVLWHWPQPHYVPVLKLGCNYLGRLTGPHLGSMVNPRVSRTCSTAYLSLEGRPLSRGNSE